VNDAKISGVKREERQRIPIVAFLLEIAIYLAFVIAYFFLTLHFFGDWLKATYDHHKYLYAGASLALIAAQGFVLETVTTALSKLFRGKGH